MAAWNMARINAGDEPVNLALLTTESQQQRLRAYCDEHPLGDYVTAIASLLGELSALTDSRKTTSDRLRSK
jgi:hypothetical protein